MFLTSYVNFSSVVFPFFLRGQTDRQTGRQTDTRTDAVKLHVIHTATHRLAGALVIMNTFIRIKQHKKKTEKRTAKNSNIQPSLHIQGGPKKPDHF